MKKKLIGCLGAMVVTCVVTGCSAPAGSASEEGAESVGTSSEAFNPSPSPSAAKGHVLITQKALQILKDRKLLPALLADAKNQALIIYGNNFADKSDVGWPNPDSPNAALTTEMRNAMSSRIPAEGLPVTSTQALVSFDFSAEALGIDVEPNALITPKVSIQWMPPDTKHASASLRYMTDVKIYSLHFARTLDPRDSNPLHLEKDMPDEYSVDNLYHYALGDLRDLNDPSIGEGDTRLRMYPLIVEHTAEDDGSLKNADLSKKLVERSVNQSLLTGADFGATKYGAILYNLARKFFEANTVAQPDIRDLIRVGNDVPGWHTGRMQGHGEMSAMKLDFPHTYLGGMPYACMDSQSSDSCFDGKPTWPSWIRSTPPTDDASLRELTKQNPGRSNRAGLIYLGWATHMMQDSSLPHHVANWTGKEHGRQDGVGDLEYLYKDFTGQTVQECIYGIPKLGSLPKGICKTVPHPYAGKEYSKWLLDPSLAPDLDALLGPVNAPKNRDEVCRSLGISDDTLLAVGNGWQSLQPLYLANARRAFGQRQEFLRGDAGLAEAREYVKHAVLGTLKLLYCALPQAATPAPAQKRPRVFQDNSKSGVGQTLQPGLYDVLMPAPRSLLAGNDQISSIDVPAGYAVTLYADAGEKGKSITFGGGSSASGLGSLGFNELTSSISVTHNGERPSFFLRLTRDWIDNGPTRSYGARRYLDVRGTGSAASDQNLPLKSWEYTGSWSQTFAYDPATHAIMNPTNGLCLDIPRGDASNGNGVELYACHGGANQQWDITTNGQIVSALGKCLEVGGDDISVGARAQIWDCIGSEMQAFDVVYGCSHDPCQVGPALTSSCSPDVGDVCQMDGWCCTNDWDGQCVSELPTKCL